MRAICILILLASPALGQASEPLPDFDTDVLPILTKAGCNAAACHGAAAGRGGFKLSLFGADPAEDYAEVVYALEGRRLDRRHPDDSLLLAKPTLRLDHEGGLRLEKDSAAAESILHWIERGAPRVARRVTAMHVVPASTVVEELPAEFSLRVTADVASPPFAAHSPKGSPKPSSPKPSSPKPSSPKPSSPISPHDPDAAGVESRDVTSLALYTAVDPAAIRVAADGRVTVLRPGRHTIVVRYQGEVRTVHMTAPLPASAVDAQVTSSPPKRNDGISTSEHWIDRLVQHNLDTLRIAPAPAAEDATLLRRVTLDLTGRLPRPAVVQEYLASSDPNKYEQQVDRLLGSEAFTDFWTYRFAKLLRIHAPPQEPEVAEVFHGWLRQEIAEERGLDQIARQLILSSGDTHVVGPANFHRMTGDPLAQAEYFSEALMAVRLRCANCHDHPLDHWTQDDYHGLAAIFASVERGREIRFTNRSRLIHPATGEPARLRIPGQDYLPLVQHGEASPRTGRADSAAALESLAEWLISPDNPYFARAQVNRLWKGMIGRGFFEPTDDLRSTNAASSPELLGAMAEHFRKNGFRIRPLLKEIAMTRTYRRADRSADSPQPASYSDLESRFFAIAISRPLEAEVLADAIADVTGVPQAYDNSPPGTRAVELVDSAPGSAILEVLGRCDRKQGCEPTEGAGGGGLSSRLHLLNGALINAKLNADTGLLQQHLAAGDPTSKIVSQFYLRALSRPPSNREQQYWLEQIEDAADRSSALEDFVWSLLNCVEFRTNH